MSPDTCLRPRQRWVWALPRITQSNFVYTQHILNFTGLEYVKGSREFNEIYKSTRYIKSKTPCSLQGACMEKDHIRFKS